MTQKVRCILCLKDLDQKQVKAHSKTKKHRRLFGAFAIDRTIALLGYGSPCLLKRNLQLPL